MWVAGRGSVSCPTGDTFGTAGPLVRRGRVLDGSGCIVVLSQLIRRYSDPIPPGSVAVVCRPVLATMAEQDAIRRVVAGVFAPARVLFIDTVRAAAIGAGAAAGCLLIADIGVELTEVAVLDHGRVKAACRADIGTRDLARGAPTDLVAHRHHPDDQRTTPRPNGAGRNSGGVDPRPRGGRRWRHEARPELADRYDPAHPGAVRGVATGRRAHRCRPRCDGRSPPPGAP